jgi:D-beta-D-heptose 7-phosphate kinase / D-beta-D-heptose 1-phosphate adenosyltransferase
MNARSKLFCDIIGSFPRMRVLVIGDLILDVYLKGTTTRLSPEAPVPVVDVTETDKYPGGASNTVCNLRALGAQVTYCTVIGEDAHGDEVIQMLDRIQVPNDYVIRDKTRKTMCKTRVVSGHHVITRIDEGTRDSLTDQTAGKLVHAISKAYSECDAVIVSDYDKGVITDRVIETLGNLKRADPKFIAVDSKRLAAFRSLGASLMKPNYDEIAAFGKFSFLTGRARIEQISDQAKNIIRQLNAGCVVVTLDADGSVVLGNDGAISHHAAPVVHAPSVSGAGDTYLSAFTLASLATSDSRLSAEIATAAAFIAVSKDSTSACSSLELTTYFNRQNKYVADISELACLVASYRKLGKRIVFTNGCFDIIHSGHVNYLQCAKELGDVLIVGLNTDESIRRLKGESRPVNSLDDRLQVMCGLASVDHIIDFGSEDDDTPVPLIRVIQPDVFVKGGDYREESLPEAESVRENGGAVVILPHVPDHSTTRIIAKIRHAKMLTSVADGDVE